MTAICNSCGARHEEPEVIRKLQGNAVDGSVLTGCSVTLTCECGAEVRFKIPDTVIQ